jgi:hypothetical protein
MWRRIFIGVALLIPFSLASSAQQGGATASRGLIGTWTLVSLQRPGNGPEPATVPNPRGMLVFDRAGHALEIATRAGRAPNAGAQATPADAQVTFSNYAGFWGGYRVDEPQKRITYRPEGAVNPNLMGKDLTRSFELTEDRLTVTALPDAIGPEKGMRWVWERVPTLENLSAAQRQLTGFWQHVVERRVNATTGAVISETRRAPSLIVYTPAGFVGVHFPPLNRKSFAGDLPTDDEARAAISGYVGYYGVYLLYPGTVYHHQLATLGGNVTSFKRFFEITGEEINLKFPPAMNQGQTVRTIVTLKRLSGEADMLPR